MKRQGYYTKQGYKGLVGNEYMLFDTESEYVDYVEFTNRQSYFLDPQGIFGKCHDVVSEGDIIEYWNNNFASDPTLRGYTSFEAWWKETREFLDEV